MFILKERSRTREKKKEVNMSCDVDGNLIKADDDIRKFRHTFEQLLELMPR